MTCNKNAIPFNHEDPFVTSGIQLDTFAGTTRGFGEEAFRKVGELVLRVIDALSGNLEDEATVLTEVGVLCAADPTHVL